MTFKAKSAKSTVTIILDAELYATCPGELVLIVMGHHRCSI